MKGTDITQAVCAHYGIKMAALAGPSRIPKLVEARWVAALLMRDLLKYSYARAGALLNRDHSTIWHGITRIRARIQCDRALAGRLADLAWQIHRRVSHETVSQIFGISPSTEHEERL